MRLVVALSGGVDSAVAAARLVRDGADVVAVHYRTGATGADPAAPAAARSCCGADDARDARAVAARLGVPFYVLDVADAFARRVTDDFTRSYLLGRTPNPCVACNAHVKFGRLRELAEGFGAEAVATGHYARTAPRADGGVRLLQGLDPRKDQSYVLATLTQEQLRAARFPLGDARKEDVRAEARALGLAVADKRDSQELCFVPEGDARAELRRRAPEAREAGDVVDLQGRVVGRHDGAAGYTPGQRRGLGLALGAPAHVQRVDVAARRVVVGPRDRLLARRVVASDVVWTDVDAGAVGADDRFEVGVRIRHAAAPVEGVLAPRLDGSVEVALREPAFAPAPGQLLVAYRGDAVLCAGPIETSTGVEEGSAA